MYQALDDPPNKKWYILTSVEHRVDFLNCPRQRGKMIEKWNFCIEHIGLIRVSCLPQKVSVVFSRKVWFMNFPRLLIVIGELQFSHLPRQNLFGGAENKVR